MSTSYQNLKTENLKFTRSPNIMDEVEKGLTKEQKSPQLILLIEIRKNIQRQISKLNFRAKLLNFFDWSLFILGVLCMGLTGMRVDFPIADSLSLIQLFGIIALFSRIIEKGLNMTKIAKNTINASFMMQKLQRELILIETQFLDPHVNAAELMKSIKDEIDKIWEEFQEIGLDTFIQPDFADQIGNTNSTSRNVNINIEMDEVNSKRNLSIHVDDKDGVDINSK